MTHAFPATEGNFAIPQPPEPLPFTGERMTTAMAGQIEFEHLHRYCIARDLVAGRDVLDVASGEGYGAAILAGVARSVVGVELDPASVAHAQTAYAEIPRLAFLQGDALAIPLPEASVDAVVTFETIEHLSDAAAFLDEVRRVLRPGGLLVISTPDRSVYSAAGTDPNPYHVHELTAPEFDTMLRARFANVAVASQRPMLGSVVAGPDGGWRSYERRTPGRAEASPGLARAPYLVALASDAPLPALPSSAYLREGRVHDVLEAAARAAPLAADVERFVAERNEARAEASALQAHIAGTARETARLQAALDAAAAHDTEAAAAHQAAAHAWDDERQALSAARDEAEASRAAMHRRSEEAGWAADDAARERDGKAAHIGHLLGLVAERAEAWERVHVVLRAAEARATEAEAARDAAHGEAGRMRRSWSWRLTRPLRLLARAANLPRRAIAGRALRNRKQAEIAAIRATPLFDAAWYAARTPDAGADPAAHYAWVGADQGLDPNPWFDTGWYRARHPGARDRNALLHWLQEGAPNGLDPNPFLRASWYARRYPEAAADPLLHWITTGGPGLLDPNPMLDAEALVAEYPAVRDSGIDPMLHWWRHGVVDGLNPHPLFDAAWYTAQNALPPGTDPLAHWLDQGEAQGLPTHPILHRAATAYAPAPFAVTPDPVVSVIVPAYSHPADTWRCLHALALAADPAIPMEVIVADDCPEHRVVPLLERRIAGVRWIQNPENTGFLRSCNAAEQLAVGRYVVFLNNDAEVHPGWLAPLVRLAEADPLVGMVGCMLLNADGTVQEAGGSILQDGWGEPFGAGGDAARDEYQHVRTVDVVVGAAFLVRRAAFDALGGFDPRYAPAFYEEFDLAFGLRAAGLKTLYQPASRVTHRGSNSYGAEMRDRQSLLNHGKFCAKWDAVLAGQPARADPPLLRRQRPPAAGHALVIDDRVLEWNRQAGALTTRQYIGLLQREGYGVTYCAAADPTPIQPYLDEMRQDGIEVLLGVPTLRRWLLDNGDALQLVWLARPDVAGPLLSAMRVMTGARILYYTHDLHHLRHRRQWELSRDPWALEESKRLQRVEHAIFAGVDQVMTPSGAEAAIIRSEVPGAAVQVIPPYILQPRPALPARAEPDSVVFVGGFAHPPNVDAALFLVRDVMPNVWAAAPTLRCVLVGHGAPPEVQALAGTRVEVAGFVEDLDTVYRNAVCTVSPLRYGAGVKGKIVGSIEAMTPVVTTTIGNEGLDLRPGEEAMVADGAENLAQAVLALWRDPARRAAMAAASLSSLRGRYSGATALAALRRAIGRRSCRVCGATTPPPPMGAANWREAVACPECWALNRMEAVAAVLVEAYGVPGEPSLRAIMPRLAGMRIHEFGFVGPIAGHLRELPGFTCSDFFPGVPLGETASNGVRCEDMTALTFPDAGFDLIVSQDVLEHVPDPAAALRECLRVLKPGGRMVLSVPCNPGQPDTVQRARMDAAGEVVHLLPPEYHGDPVRKEGALVFSDFGRDLAGMIEAAGFHVVPCEQTEPGERNGYVMTFDATRTATGP